MSFAGDLATIVSEIAWEIDDDLSRDVDDRRQAMAVLERYVATYQHRYGVLRLPGNCDGIPLAMVGARVRFWDRLHIRHAESLEVGALGFGEDGQDEGLVGQGGEWDGVAIAATHQYLTVRGGPGAGKSTFLQRVGLEALKGEAAGFERAYIPVFLNLQDLFAQEVADLDTVIAAELASFGFPATEAFVPRLLERGRLLILLDGLDEVPRAYLKVAVEIVQDFIVRYDRNRFIVSFQPATVDKGFVGFVEIELAEFSAHQSQTFIQLWFESKYGQSSDECSLERGQQCWKQLGTPENTASRMLARTPLSLAFLCAIYDRCSQLPSRFCQIYQQGLEVLLDDLAAAAEVQAGAEGLELNLEQARALFAQIAYQGCVCDRFIFQSQQRDDLVQRLLAEGTLLRNGGDCLDDLTRRERLQGVLGDAIAQSGVLRQQSQGRFSFLHLTLQEFLAAQYLCSQGQIDRFVAEHVTDGHWREVFLFIAGLMPQVDDLLVQLESEAQSFVRTPRLQSLLTWATQTTTASAGTLKSAAKRAAALALVLVRALARTRALYRAYSRDLYRGRDRSLIHDRSPIRNRAAIRNRALDLYRLLNRVLSLYQALHPDPALDLELYLYRALNLEPDLSLTRDRTLDLDLDLYLQRDRTLYRDRDRTLACDFEAVQIFQAVDFQTLIAQLTALKTGAPDNDQSLQTFQTFTEQIYDTWLHALQVQRDWIELSRQDIDALVNYLYVGELIVKCKEAALQVSQPIWQRIEAQLLSVVHG